jgi:hypothetical protein
MELPKSFRFEPLTRADGKPRGSRKRGSEVYRVHTLVTTNILKERHYKTLVLSDEGMVYEYKQTTKEVCESLFDWSRNWICIGSRMPLSANQWLDKKRSEGWLLADRREAKKVYETDEEYKKKRRRHDKTKEPKLVGKFNPSIGKQIPTRPIDFLKPGDRFMKRIDRILDKAAKEDEKLKEQANKVLCTRCKKMVDRDSICTTKLCTTCTTEIKSIFAKEAKEAKQRKGI